MGNLFKVNNADTRMTSVDFEQVNDGWEEDIEQEKMTLTHLSPMFLCKSIDWLLCDGEHWSLLG